MCAEVIAKSSRPCFLKHAVGTFCVDLNVATEANLTALEK